MPVLQRFHSSVASIRSHHWKYYGDLYSRCHFHCKYCLYHGTAGNTSAPEGVVELLDSELGLLEGPGVVYLGATADIYQEGVDLELTRAALERFLAHRRALFLITRSPRILSHLGLLRELAAQGLVEVSITVNTRNITFRNHFEPGTFPHRDRIEVARILTENGIPVSFHFSPIIPGLDGTEELLSLMEEMAQAGGACIYSCLYGMSADYRNSLIPLFERVRPGLGESMSRAYPAGEAGIISPSDELALAVIEPLARYARRQGFTFVSAQFPTLDVGERTSGIFREKLPTVGDLLRASLSLAGDLRLEDLLRYLRGFPAVDQEYLDAIWNYWHSGELFKNTTLSPVIEDGMIQYYQHQSRLDIETKVMLVAR